VNWVLDLDSKAFFDGLSHEWLVKFVEHRIADRRVVRLIQKWLNAGVLEDGKRIRLEEGTPQAEVPRPFWLTSIFITYSLRLKPNCLTPRKQTSVTIPNHTARLHTHLPHAMKDQILG
jgi:retron-type reverse transcriptase